jgi:pimeloyl-ACP methyl ester carboxylesterase
LKCDKEVEALVFEAAGSVELFEQASRVDPPSLFLWAQQGNFPRVFYEELCRKMAKAEIVDADAGHLIPMERPDWVADRALEFCSRG